MKNKILKIITTEEAQPFMDVLRQFHGLVIIKDDQDLVVWSNKENCTELGLSLDKKITGQKVSDLFTFVPADKYAKIDLEVIASKQPRLDMTELIDEPSQETSQLVRIDKIPFIDVNGECIGVVTYVINLTTTLDEVITSYSNDIRYQQVRFDVSKLISSIRAVR